MSKMESIVPKFTRHLCLMVLLISIILSTCGSSADKIEEENEIHPNIQDSANHKELDKDVCSSESDCSLEQKSKLLSENIAEIELNHESVVPEVIDSQSMHHLQENTKSNTQTEELNGVSDNHEEVDNDATKDNLPVAEHQSELEDASVSNIPLSESNEESQPNTDELTATTDNEKLSQNTSTSNSTVIYDWFRYFVDSFLEEFKEGPALKQQEKENTTNISNTDVVLNETVALNMSIVSPPSPVNISNDTQAAIQNITETGKKFKFECIGRNVTDNVNSTVKIITSAKLLQLLSFDKNETENTTDCIVVMFYAPWCKFCAKTAPHFNALARAFPQLDFLAVDTAQFSNILARFGTVSVPNVLVFHQSRSTVKFNQTERVFENFVSFLQNTTGLEPNISVVISDEDYVGPVPSVPTDDPDYLLLLSWIFVIFCSTCMFVKSTKGQQWITRIRVLWQEHQHID